MYAASIKLVIPEWKKVESPITETTFVSSFFNFNANTRLVFGHQGRYGRALLRYYCLAVPIMLCSAGIVTVLDRVFGVTAPVLSTAIKICVDAVLFLASYTIQKKWVFSQNTEKKKTDS